MNWITVSPDRNKKTRSSPCASVGHGRISLNVASCNLLEDYEQYKFVEFLIAEDQKSIIGLRFLTESTESSVSIKRKTANGKIVGGLEIASKDLVQRFFGITGTQKKTTAFPVTKDCENILVVHIK